MRRRIKPTIKGGGISLKNELIMLGRLYNVFDNHGNMIKRKLHFRNINSANKSTYDVNYVTFINFKGHDFIVEDKPTVKLINGERVTGWAIKSKTLNFKSSQSNFKSMYSVKKNY